MRTYEVELIVMVERTVYLEVNVEKEHDNESWEFQQELLELAEEKYFSEPYTNFDCSEETDDIQIQNWEEL